MDLKHLSTDELVGAACAAWADTMKAGADRGQAGLRLLEVMAEMRRRIKGEGRRLIKVVAVSTVYIPESVTFKVVAVSPPAISPEPTGGNRRELL